MNIITCFSNLLGWPSQILERERERERLQHTAESEEMEDIRRTRPSKSTEQRELTETKRGITGPA